MNRKQMGGEHWGGGPNDWDDFQQLTITVHYMF